VGDYLMSITLDGTNGITTPALDSTGGSTFTTLSASTSLTTPLVTNAGTLALSATGSNIVTVSTNGSERAQFDAAGNLLVGTTSSQANVTASDNTSGFSYQIVAGINSGVGIGSTAKNDYATQLNRQGNTDGGIAAFRRNGVLVGTISVTGSATTYSTSSDYRLKEDVQPMVGASDRLMALKPVNFAWKVDGSRVDGFLAHEAQEVVPECVTGEKDAVDDEGNPQYQGIDQSKIVPLLVAALQEALTKIEALEARVAALETNA
jgi:hypothetical protein